MRNEGFIGVVENSGETHYLRANSAHRGEL